MIGLKLGKHLSGLADIRNRVEQASFGGIYPDAAPQKAPYPRIVVSVIGGAPDYELGGEISDISKTVQVDVDASSRHEANTIAELIRTNVGFVTAPTTWDDVTIQSVVIENERDQAFSPTDAGGQWIYRRSIDYRVTFER